MKIIIHCVYPPIPDRRFDYCVYDEDSYDGAPDAGWQCVGWGRTAEEALADFHERMEEHDV